MKVYIISSPISERYAQKGYIGTLDGLCGNIRVGGAWFPFDDRWVVKTAGELWAELGDVPVTENEELDAPFLDFEIGTDNTEVWHWFEEAFDLSVGDDLLFKEKEIFCPICKASCGSGMGSGRIWMLHHTVGCEAAKRY